AKVCGCFHCSAVRNPLMAGLASDGTLANHGALVGNCGGNTVERIMSREVKSGRCATGRMVSITSISPLFGHTFLLSTTPAVHSAGHRWRSRDVASAPLGICLAPKRNNAYFCRNSDRMRALWVIHSPLLRSRPLVTTSLTPPPGTSWTLSGMYSVGEPAGSLSDSTTQFSKL